MKSEFIVRDAEKALKEAGYSASEAKTIISIIKSTVMDDENTPTAHEMGEEMVVETPKSDESIKTEENASQNGSQSEKTATPSDDEEENEELKDFLNYLKDMENPKSCGLELSEDDQKALSDWMKEVKQEDELRRFRDFLAKI